MEHEEDSNTQETTASVWRPILLTDKTTGRSVNISIFDHEMYLSDFFSFEDLWRMYSAPDEQSATNNLD